ncbi:DinB family protein [bacterium]|nr:DinB family protein [bacterium]MCI0607382.1 DinB family protein [bacterium]
MEMKQYLIDTFKYNDRANRQILQSIEKLPQKDQAIKFFSHLINSQKKWLARIIEYPNNPKMSWWEPAYPLENLEVEWSNSLQAWLRYLEEKKEEDLNQDVIFIGYDGGKFSAKLQDIALQLNYHNIHHRAQIQSLIREQGLEPEFVDYIGTVYRKL